MEIVFSFFFFFFLLEPQILNRRERYILRRLLQIFASTRSMCIHRPAQAAQCCFYTGDAAHIMRRPSTRKKGETTWPGLIAMAINLLISTQGTPIKVPEQPRNANNPLANNQR
ncbi:hypothetical protein ACS0PU_010618 [Formica fusca]